MPLVVTAIIYPRDAVAVAAASVAARLGIIEPVFYGPAASRDLLMAAGELSRYRWLDTGDGPQTPQA